MEGSGQVDKKRLVWRRMISVAGLLVVLGVGWVLWESWDEAAMREWKEDAHPAVFFALMAVLPAFGFPATPLYLVAGATYGVAVGLLGTWIAVAANLAICYWIAKSGLRPGVIRLLDWAGIRLPEVERKNELKFTVLVKLTPGVPVFAKNYLLGLADVSFRIYFPVSLGIAGVFASLFVILGESVFDHDPWTAVPVVAFLLLLSGGIYWWRKKHRKG